MTILEITHIKKPDRFSTVDSIQEVAGSGWGPWTLAYAVQWAETYGNRFIVRGSLGTQIDVKVMPPKSFYGSKYLQTVSDRTETNNLLSLPEITSAMYARR